MRTIVSFIISLALGIIIANAQDLKVPATKDLQKATSETAKQVSSQANLGSLVGQLTDNLSDKALTEDFKKKKGDFTNSVNSTKDPVGLSSALQSLQGGLLPTAMDAGWGSVKGKWIKDAKTANTIKTVAGLAQTLESHISPAVFKGDWAKTKPVWETALGTLAK